jgi:glycerophosphoryl diester phosphodiesterase
VKNLVIHRPLVVAHRGSSGSAPENTMAAFRKALEAGADMIELDVRMTVDRHIVVHHDRSLGRTSDGRGRVATKTLRELRTLDAGSWFSRSFRNERIPTLAEVLEELPHSLGINIEAKRDGLENAQAFEDSLLRLIRKARRIDSVVVSSFDHVFLRRLHLLAPSLVLGVLYVPVRDRFRRVKSLARHAGASVFVCSRNQLRVRHVREAHANAIHIAVYGINSGADLDIAKGKGVDAVITDYPERILPLLRDS